MIPSGNNGQTDPTLNVISTVYCKATSEMEYNLLVPKKLYKHFNKTYECVIYACDIYAFSYTPSPHIKITNICCFVLCATVEQTLIFIFCLFRA